MAVSDADLQRVSSAVWQADAESEDNTPAGSFGEMIKNIHLWIITNGINPFALKRGVSSGLLRPAGKLRR